MAAQSYTFLVSFPAFTRWHAILEGLDILPAMKRLSQKVSTSTIFDGQICTFDDGCLVNKNGARGPVGLLAYQNGSSCCVDDRLSSNSVTRWYSSWTR